MASPPARTDQPHLVSLVLQSKKALQHGEFLCSKANTLTNASAQCAVDILALDAKVKWITHAVVEQLKVRPMLPAVDPLNSPHSWLPALQRALSTNAPNSTSTSAYVVTGRRFIILIELPQEWDAVRSERTFALDTILESLGAQLVPPGFHETSADSSLFGSQHSLDKANGIIEPTQSPSATVRLNVVDKKLAKKHVDRSTWKTLRDFVDESAIEQVLEAVESDRTKLDVRVLLRTMRTIGMLIICTYRMSCRRRMTTQRPSQPRSLLYVTLCPHRTRRLRSSLCWFSKKRRRR